MSLPVHALFLMFVALSTSALSAQQDELRTGETVKETRDLFPYAQPLDADGNDTVWCVRIVDAFDRRPIPGALVMVPWHPSGGVVDAELHHQCVGIADEYGWARLPWAGVRGYDDYVFADAPGYAAEEHCEPGDEECELQRGVDVPVELIDYTGRPVPGGRIELVLGCGHVPCQRSVVADAQGRATLPAILPSRLEDFFVWSPQCLFGTYDLRRMWRPGDPPVPIDVVPGRTAAGRIVDTNGAPVVGARVGAQNGMQPQQRPWTRTDFEGRFLLVGLKAWQELVVQPPPHLGLPEDHFIAPPADVERTHVLGLSISTHDVPIQTVAATGEPAGEVRVVAVRSNDGFTATVVTDKEGAAILPLPTGEYRLSADGELGPFGRFEGTLSVGDAPPEPVVISVPKNPTVRVDASRIIGMTLGITTATQYRVLKPSGIDGTDVPIPAGERATFRISMRDDLELHVRFIEIPGPGSSLVLEGPPQTQVRARFVGLDGKPLAASLHVQREHDFEWLAYYRADEDASPTAEIATHLVGTVTWIACPEDESLAPMYGDIVLRGGVDTDLGEVRFAAPREPNLTLVLPEDLKGSEASVAGKRIRINGSSWSQFDEQGVVTSGYDEFAAGDLLWIRLDARLALPFRFVAPGPPPWTVHYPTSTLTIELSSSNGLPLTDVVAILDGKVFPGEFAETSSLRLRGVAAGAHTLVVAEADHLALIYHLVMHEDDQRTLHVTLNPRAR